MLQQLFTDLVHNHNTDAAKAQALWAEVKAAYTGADRYFHNLAHLEDLVRLLTPVKTEIEDWDTLLFSVFYHDVVYVPSDYVVNSRDEEASAAVAKTHLDAIGYPAHKTDRCLQQILATKSHQVAADNDTNFFTDADLAVLGRPWSGYSSYQKEIRAEFIVYPNNIFKAGRSKVLTHFLQMPRIYKTDHFYQLFEEQARENIAQELELLVVAL